MMSDRKYSARWKRAKRLEEKCACDQKAASEFLPTNIPLQCPSVLYQHQEHTGEGASVEQNGADDGCWLDFRLFPAGSSLKSNRQPPTTPKKVLVVKKGQRTIAQMYGYILDDSCIPAYMRAIFMRLDKIEQSLETIQSILTKDMRSDDPEIEELTSPLKTPAELKEASEKRKDRAHRKKVVCCCISLCVCVCMCKTTTS